MASRSLRKFSCSSVQLPKPGSKLNNEVCSKPNAEEKNEDLRSRGTTAQSELNVSMESGYSSDTEGSPQVTTKRPRRKLFKKFKKSNSTKLLKAVLKRNQDKVNMERLHENLQESSEKTGQSECPSSIQQKGHLNVEFVSSSCVSKLVKRNYRSYVLIDGRCPMAFRDSHIQGSVNLPTYQSLYEFYTANAKITTSNVPVAVIFVSEDVTTKAWRMASFFRSIDLSSGRSTLLFPRVYVLNDSYINFSRTFSRCCEAYIWRACCRVLICTDCIYIYRYCVNKRILTYQICCDVVCYPCVQALVSVTC